MRIISVILAAAAAAVAWSASGQSAGGEAMGLYLAELDHQCPQSQLQYLAPGQLRDGLDDFVSSLPSDTQDQMRRAETAQCSSGDGGATCVNHADIDVAARLNLTDQLAATLCGDFLRCRAPSDCDAAR